MGTTAGENWPLGGLSKWLGIVSTLQWNRSLHEKTKSSVRKTRNVRITVSMTYYCYLYHPGGLACGRALGLRAQECGGDQVV